MTDRTQYRGRRQARGSRQRLQADPILVKRLEELEQRLQAIEDIERRLAELEALLPQLQAAELKAKRLRAETHRLTAQRAGRPIAQVQDAQGLTRIQDAVRRKVLAYRRTNWN
jgi:DNA repair exonuclease SbcCD ATPase subunit